MKPPRKRFSPKVYADETKLCPVCGKVFHRHPRYTDKMWNGQVCCSHSCAMRRRHPKRDPWVTFLSYVDVDPESGCWLWTGTTTYQGYGQFAVNGQHNIKAHRFAYEALKGPIPDDLSVLHKCDVRNCVNPDHLYVGTPADNARDAVVRGRSCRGVKNASARLTETDVLKIRASTSSAPSLADKFDVAESTIRAVQKGITWGWVK